ncbi:MAG: VWA domain-containing protein, partial [Actinobacteria bacterium]|nr:VWA domain-containing protein [Actinomycetota bacterium]
QNEPTILDWMNHDSDYDGVAPIGTDFEIRGSGTTPLAGILGTANTYLDDVRADDLRVACRPYRVILVTDGAETCGGNPQAAAAALLGDGIPVHVIGFATPDPTVIANLDSIALAGGTTRAILVDDEAALSSAIGQIIEDSILFEQCNGLDDDCDSRVDEDFPDRGQACDNGEEGECFETGVRVCAADGQGTVCNAPDGTPGTEICNALDDDCDSRVDEGLGGTCTCNPVQEICNGRDDDCDLAVDEGTLPGVGDTCGATIGVCDPGNLQCISGALECVGETGPGPEVCDNEDDDCDTFVDEVSTICYEPPTGCTISGGVGTCEGVCQTGLRGCVDGADGPCVGDVGPSGE